MIWLTALTLEKRLLAAAQTSGTSFLDGAHLYPPSMKASGQECSSPSPRQGHYMLTKSARRPRRRQKSERNRTGVRRRRSEDRGEAFPLPGLSLDIRISTENQFR